MAEVRKMVEKFFDGRKIVFLLIVLSIIVFSGCVNNPTTDAATGPIDTSLSDIRERGKIVVGAAAPYKPMVFFDGDDETNIIGHDADLARHIASELGVSLEIIDIPWDDIFGKVDSGEIDLIVSAVTIKEERKKILLFSIPYFNAGIVFIAKKERDDIRNNEDLKKLKVGLQKRTSFGVAGIEYLNRTWDSPLVEIYTSASNNTATRDVYLEDLRSGKTDAFAIEYAAGVVYVNNNPDLKIVDEPFKNDFYGIATELGNEALMDEINRILREMKRTGKLKQLEDKWLR